MRFKELSYYLRNCFLLLIPVIAWNIIFINYLPEPIKGSYLQFELPILLLIAEILSGILVFLLPVFMPLSIKTKSQQAGLVVYIAGLVLYLVAWRPIILFPDSIWTNSLAGFTSLAIAPIILLTGIGLIGKKLYFGIHYKRWHYVIIMLIFVSTRTWQIVNIYYQNY